MILLIIGGAIAFNILACTLGVWLLDKIVIAILNAHPVDPTGNEALKNWLLSNPDKTIDDFLPTIPDVNPYTHTKATDHPAAFRTYKVSPVVPDGNIR